MKCRSLQIRCRCKLDVLLICLWILSVSSFSIFLFCLFVFLSPYQAIRTWWWERTSTAWRTAASSATWVTPTPRLTWSVAVFPESHLTYFCKKHSLTPVHLLVSVLVWPSEVFPQKSNSDWMLFVHYQASVPVSVVSVVVIDEKRVKDRLVLCPSVDMCTLIRTELFSESEINQEKTFTVRGARCWLAPGSDLGQSGFSVVVTDSDSN